MGIKDIIMNKMVNKILSRAMSNMDMNAIAKDAKNGKYDLDKMLGAMEKMIGKETTEKLIKEAQTRIDRGEKVSMSMIMDLMKKVDLSKIKDKAESGEISADSLQSELKDIVGEKQTNKIFSEASEVVEELKDEEKE